jgi:MFS family permease
MQLIKAPYYSTDTLFLVLNKFLERSGYYGMRANVLIYLVQTLNVPATKASWVYGIFSIALVGGMVIGGLIGDLVSGNRKALIIGSALQTLGCFTMVIPNEQAVYAGLLLIVLGSGLCSPNSMALMARTHINAKTLDGGFGMMMLATNLGAFLGVLVVAMVSVADMKVGFGLSGIFLMLSTVFAILVKEPEIKQTTNTVSDISLSVLLIFLLIAAAMIFWGANELFGDRIFRTHRVLSENLSLQSVLMVVLFIPMILFGTFVYVKPVIKNGFGLLVGAFGLLLLISVPEQFELAPDFSTALSITILLSLAEALFLPSLLTALCRFSNEKYYALIISAYLVLTRLTGIVVLQVQQVMPGASWVIISISLMVMALAIGIVIFGIYLKEPFINQKYLSKEPLEE